MEQRVTLERKQYRDILGFVRRRTAWSEAEDVTQEVFASAAEKLRRSGETTAPTLNWLYTVARRRLADRARRRRLEFVPLDQAPEAPASGDEYGAAVAAALNAALARLTAPQREVVILRLYGGRAFAEIAASLDVSEEACRMRFMRGLQALRGELEKEGLTP